MQKIPKILILGFCLVVLFISYYFYTRKDITYSKPEWHCKKGKCEVSFTLENKTSNYVTCKVSIRALRRLGSKQSSTVNRICGETTLNIELNPEELREIVEVVDVSYPAYMMQVYLWDIKKGV